MKIFEGSISQLVPHRGLMLLIDRLLFHNEETVRTEAMVTRDRLFLEALGWPAWVGLELMAQTVAAWGGLRQWAAEEPVKLGFLLGSRRYESTVSHFAVGAKLEIEARQELVSESGLAVFECSIHQDGARVASAHLNVFQPPDVEAYLRESTHV